jgi:hypothetical protein
MGRGKKSDKSEIQRYVNYQSEHLFREGNLSGGCLIIGLTDDNVVMVSEYGVDCGLIQAVKAWLDRQQTGEPV